MIIELDNKNVVSIPNNKFLNKTIVIIDKLNILRNEAKHKIINMGGVLTDKVTKNTNYLIVGKKPGYKEIIK